MLSIGVLADNKTMFNEALDYFYNGGGNGAIKKTIWQIYDDGTGQVQEVWGTVPSGFLATTTVY